MSVRESFLEFVLEQLADVPRVTTRQMFGEIGLYSEAIYFGIVADDALYLKVDDTTRGRCVDAGSRPFQPYADRPDAVMKGYYTVPASVIEDRDALTAWAEQAIVVGSKPKRRRGSKKR